MKNSSMPILVTGLHRSGTTWTGRIISAAPHVAYIHEPFNPHENIGMHPNPFKYWFQHVCAENSEEYVQTIDKIVHFKYHLGRGLAKARTARDMVRAIKDQGSHLLNRINRNRPLIKDPIAFFSAEWMYKKYNMDVLVLLRHPAAFCSSLKIKNWEFDFNNFLEQPLLMEKYLYPFEEDIQEFAKNKRNVIEQGILLWNCFYSTIAMYREKYPEWLFIKHEDLSIDPIGRFRSIYRKFGLEFTHKVERIIRESSGPHNPVDRHNGDEFARNSAEVIKAWKKRLSPHEMLRIREGTSRIAGMFYGEMEW